MKERTRDPWTSAVCLEALPADVSDECTIYGGAFVVQPVESSTVRTSTQNLSLMRAFAAELRGRRHVLGVSQEELAFLAGVNRTFIAKVELAQNQPSLTVLVKIAEALRIPVQNLLEETMTRYRVEIDANT